MAASCFGASDGLLTYDLNGVSAVLFLLRIRNITLTEVGSEKLGCAIFGCEREMAVCTHGISQEVNKQQSRVLSRRLMPHTMTAHTARWRTGKCKPDLWQSPKRPHDVRCVRFFEIGRSVVARGVRVGGRGRRWSSSELGNELGV